MLPGNRIILFAAIVSLLLSSISLVATHCDQSYGTSNSVPFPFGFSPSCHIPLNCSGGQIRIGDFPVRMVTSDSLLIDASNKCHRPIQSLRRLFSRNFAPTLANAILLQNCSESRLEPCGLTESMLQIHFEARRCHYSSSSHVRCYLEKNQNGFMRFENLTSTGCQSIYSSIIVDSVNYSAVSLDVQMIRLAWWLEGDCRCSPNAKCSELSSPTTGKPGFRCRCEEGFSGDGYLAGEGCRKVSSSCRLSEYFSGRCGRTASMGVLFLLFLGITVAAIAVIGAVRLLIRRLARRNRFSVDVAKWLVSEATGACGVPLYAYRDMEKATDSFAEQRRLGTGAYGTVYLGRLCNNESVAVKRIRRRDAGGVDQVINEIRLLSSVHHPGLVRLLGCSLERGEQVLVFEFMPNGTLSQHLQRERGAGIDWPARLAIAAETAHAVSYLHAGDPPIYHRDIKSNNILLDFRLRSKLADFGLSCVCPADASHVSTTPQGTPGYLDPQYSQNFRLSDRSDVYSFGVVLLEIITAMRAVDLSRPRGQVNLATLATERIRDGRVEELIDPTLGWDAPTLSSVHRVTELAFRCLAFQQEARPSMMEVAANLEQIRLDGSSRAAEDNDPIRPDSPAGSSNESPEPAGSVKSRSPLAVEAGDGEGYGSWTGKGEDDSRLLVVQGCCLSEANRPSTTCLLSNPGNLITSSREGEDDSRVSVEQGSWLS